MAVKPLLQCGCGHVWDPQFQGYALRCPVCKKTGAKVTYLPPSLIDLPDAPAAEQIEESPPPPRRKRWGTLLLLLTIGGVMHGLAISIIVFVVRKQEGNQNPSEVVAKGEPDRAAKKLNPWRAAPLDPPVRETPHGDAEIQIAPEPREVRPREAQVVTPETETIEIAPEPHPAGFIAPPPRIANRLPMPPGWTSDWQGFGDVHVRVRSIALAKLPLVKIETKELAFTAEKHLVVWLEVKNTSDRTHTFRRWQPTMDGECTLYGDGRAVQQTVVPPTGHRIDWADEYDRVLGIEPLIQPIFFCVPADRDSFTLKLAGSRVGETLDFHIQIPGKNMPKP